EHWPHDFAPQPSKALEERRLVRLRLLLGRFCDAARRLVDVEHGGQFSAQSLAHPRRRRPASPVATRRAFAHAAALAFPALLRARLPAFGDPPLTQGKG